MINTPSFTVARVTRHAELSAAVEEQFALAVECTLLTAASAVFQRVGSAFSQDDIGALATQQIQRGRVGIGDADAVQLHGILLVACHGKGTVICRAAQHIAYLFRVAVIGRDVTAVDGDLHPVLRLRYGVRQVDGDLRRKLVVLQDVFLVREIRISHIRRLCRCLV